MSFLSKWEAVIKATPMRPREDGNYTVEEQNHMEINLSAIAGSKESVLAEMAQRLAHLPNVSLEQCKNEAVNVVRERATRYLENMIEPAVNGAYLELTLTDGEPDPTWIFARRENWADAMDNKLETVVEPYAHLLSADWTARYTIGSKLHVAGGVQEWIKEFAGEIYRNITYLHKRGEEGAPKTAGQILTSVGVVEDDFTTFMQTRPKPTVKQVEERKMSDFNTTINKLHMWNQMTGAQAAEVMALLDNATDSDDGLALSGMSPLGGDMADVATLRQAKATMPLTAIAAYIIQGLPPAAPAQLATPLPAVPAPVAGPIPAQPMDDLSAFMGGVPVPVEQPYTPMEQSNPLGAYIAQQVAQAPMPTPPPAQAVVPPKRTRSSGKDAPPGAVNARVFQIIKEHTGLKSEEVGAAIGVSRGTFDNYAKGKAHYVPTAEHLHYLNNMLVEKITLLNEAYSLLPKVQK